MYIPRSFRMPEADAVRFIEANPFAVLFSTTADGEPMATHLPLLFLADKEPRLLGHLARANDHWRHLEGSRVLAVFGGPHAYIGPSWYGAMPNVPTWNYLAAHVTGTCRILRDPLERTEAVLRLTRLMEPDSPIPAALAREDNPDHGYYQALLDGIVAIEIRVERLEGKAKLGQNRSPDERRQVIRHLEGSEAADARRVAKVMGELPDASS